MTTGVVIWYWVSALVLAACLYRPVKRLVFVGRVRKAERKAGRELTDEERRAMEKKMVPYIVVLVVTFSFIFARYLVVKNFVTP